jgi:hypothetical protein
MFPHITEFFITDRTRLFADTMGIFKQDTSIRFCTYFHTIREFLHPSNVLHLNQSIVCFNEVHIIGLVKCLNTIC